MIDLKDLHEIAASARNGFYQISVSESDKRNAVLKSLARLLTENKDSIFAANQADRDAAEAENLSSPLLHRLTFGEEKLSQVISGLYALVDLPDPISNTLAATEITEGLKLYRVSCPIGVIGVIFESRPDALIQISSLCIKSGNAVLLKGGREAIHTNQVLCGLVRSALEENGFSPDTAQLLETREDVAQMLKEDTLIDLIIPRGATALSGILWITAVSLYLAILTESVTYMWIATLILKWPAKSLPTAKHSMFLSVTPLKPFWFTGISRPAFFPKYTVPFGIKMLKSAATKKCGN